MGPFFSLSQGFLAAAQDTEVEPGTIGFFIYLVLVLGILILLMAQAKKGFTARVFKNPMSQAAEQLYLFIENMCVGIIGPHGRKYIPYIMTFWLVIFGANVIALFFPFAPTADLSFNLGMALTAIAYVQYEGMQANGVFGHLKHFAGPKLPGILIILTPIIFFIEVISELMKNVSLSLRLFGNIHGGHKAVTAMNGILADHYITLGYLLLPIKVLTCVVQAMVFTMLNCVYLSLVTSHGDDHGEEHELGGEHALAPAH
jgi:F-type H+-transporting ATPase subunit a